MSEADGPLEPNPTSGGGSIPPDEHPQIIDNHEQENEDEESDDADADDDDGDEEEDDSDSDDEEDFVASLPPPIRKKVDELKELNQKRNDFMDDYLKERAALEKKYSEMCKPLYEKRRDIINGKHDVNSGGVEGASGDVQNTVPASSSDDNGGSTSNDNADASGIPEFWTMAMSNIETVEELVTEGDNECLQYLQDITCADFDNGLGFTLYFHFQKNNPYFTNEILIKRYDVPNLLIEDEPILKNVVGCDINWKTDESDNDMCLTFKTINKKQRNKKGQIRHVKKKERTPSFFHFFR